MFKASFSLDDNMRLSLEEFGDLFVGNSTEKYKVHIPKSLFDVACGRTYTTLENIENVTFYFNIENLFMLDIDFYNGVMHVGLQPENITNLIIDVDNQIVKC